MVPHITGGEREGDSVSGAWTVFASQFYQQYRDALRSRGSSPVFAQRYMIFNMFNSVVPNLFVLWPYFDITNYWRPQRHFIFLELVFVIIYVIQCCKYGVARLAHKVSDHDICVQLGWKAENVDWTIKQWIRKTRNCSIWIPGHPKVENAVLTWHIEIN